MTALAALFGPGAEQATEAITAMLDAMPSRGGGPTTMHGENGCLVAARQHEWERRVDGRTGPLIGVTDHHVAAVDGVLYYREDLRRRLGRIASLPSRPSTIDLIVAAVEAWGPQLIQYLEGDFAILVWDRVQRRPLLARDFLGRRMLYYSSLGSGQLVAASSVGGMTSHPDVNRELDRGALAAAAAGLVSHGDRTGYESVRAVPAGAVLMGYPGGRVAENARWLPPAFSYAGNATPASAAADELRHLVEHAVAERTLERDAVVVWLSGGMDSTAVFGAGQSVARSAGRGSGGLRPVSLSYPPGDPGREDEYIDQVARFWDVKVHWIDTNRVALFEDPGLRAAQRDDPFVHPFEGVIRVLARGALERDAHLVFDGYGGDQLFQVSDTALADDLWSGHWKELARKWRDRGDRSVRTFIRSCAIPYASPSLLSWLGDLRGRPVASPWVSTIPAWLRPRASLAGDSAPPFDRKPGEGAAAFESRLGLMSPYLPRSVMWVSAFGMEEGVQVRSPLYDRRIIEFAATRPVKERYSGSETKVLLRAAMRGLLPETVLAPRPRKTGVPIAYLRRQLDRYLGPALHRAFVEPRSFALADLGLVDRSSLLAAIREYGAPDAVALDLSLHTTLETERWALARS